MGSLASEPSTSIGGLFAVTPTRGFLPLSDPLQRLSSAAYSAWEDTVAEMSKLLVAAGEGRLKARLLALPPFETASLIAEGDEAQLWRAYLVLSFLAHAYIWGEDGDDSGSDSTSGPPNTLPRHLAVPWCTIADRLEVPPVMTYATFVSLNWRRLDEREPVRLGNIVSLHNFLGGLDEGVVPAGACRD